MLKALKVVGMVVGGIALLVTGLIGWVQFTYEKDYSSVGLPSVQASTDPAVIAQGEYVVHALSHCSACHAPAEAFAELKLADDKHDLSGGGHFPAGPFGDFYAANLTPDPDTGIGKLSDGQVARTIRHGVDRNGRYAALMALAVGNLADEDLVAVVSYLRSIPPKRREVAKEEWGFLAKALSGKFVPRQEPLLKYVPPGEPSVERGSYIANGPAACYMCHTPRDPMQGFAEVGPRFSGTPEGEPDKTDPTYELIAPNLTPKEGTVTSQWTEDQFVARLHGGRAYAGSTMPWENFAQMTDADARSVYRYLKTLPPAEGPTGPTRRPIGGK